MQEAEITAPIGIGGAYAGLDGLRQSAQEAQHALGYAFSTGETLLFDPELRKSSGSLQTDDCPTAGADRKHAPIRQRQPCIGADRNAFYLYAPPQGA